MDFHQSEDLEAIRDLSRQIFGDACAPEKLAALERSDSGDGYDDALWRALAEANLLGIAIDETHGGSALGFSTLCALLEEAGRFTAPVPLLSTLVAVALPIAEFGTDAQKQAWLPGIASGELLLTAALEEVGSDDPGQPATRATPDGDGYVVDGEKVCVPAAGRAARVLVPARTPDGAVVVLLVDPKSEGVSIEAGVATNWERLSRVTLNGVRVDAADGLGSADEGGDVVAWTVAHARTGLCALQLGVSEAALKLTAEYTSTRRQFGREIATFQAVSMRSADGYIDIEAMRSTLWQAAWKLENDIPAGIDVAAAKWWACRGGQRVAHTAQHLHGGTGSDIDYPIHRYFLWAKQLELTLGGAGTQLARIGALMADAAA